MKIKITVHLTVFLALTAFSTGCFTTQVITASQQKPVDHFRPTAVYQTTNHESFALEGFRANDYIAAEMREPHHQFIILPPECLKSAHLETNENLSLDDILKLPPTLTHRLKLINKLPLGYVKIADLPYTTTDIELNEQPPQKGRLGAIPFTVALDVATSPIQIPFYLLVGLAMENGHM